MTMGVRGGLCLLEAGALTLEAGDVVCEVLDEFEVILEDLRGKG